MMKGLKKLPVYLALGIALVVQLYPIIWVISSSLKSKEETLATAAYAFPKAPTLENYAMLLDSNMPEYFKNSLIVAAITLFGIVVLGLLAAYPLTKMEFRGRRQIHSFFMIGIMIPIFVSLIPMFRIYNLLGLKNTYWSLVIPQVGFAIPTALYLYSGFLRQIPNELLEAACLDGAGSVRSFWSIILPMMKGPIATVAIFEFVYVWNEFTFANTFISKSEMKTVPIGLNDFINNYGLRDWGLTFAAVTATVLPTLLLFFILNKQVISGMAAGAVKE